MTETVLDATLLSTWQSCKRRAVLEADWRVLPWRPKSLLDFMLRRGIRELSVGGADLDSLIASLKAEFLQTAANPGLDTAYPPYPVAKDHVAMLETILRSVARLTLLTLHDPPPVRLSSRLHWKVSAPADDSGTLHRWITVDRWNHDRLLREMHGWRTFGDIAMTGQPMMLHAIVIGAERDGRRSSSWIRGWRHPSISNMKLRFKRRDGKAFQGWRPVYLADEPSTNVADWVDQLWREGAAQELMFHVTVNPPAETTCKDTRAQVMYEGARIAEALQERASVTWDSWAMSREACDWPTVCPFQYLCYVEDRVAPENVGIYQRKDSPPVSIEDGRRTPVLSGR